MLLGLASSQPSWLPDFPYVEATDGWDSALAQLALRLQKFQSWYWPTGGWGWVMRQLTVELQVFWDDCWPLVCGAGSWAGWLQGPGGTGAGVDPVVGRGGLKGILGLGPAHW